MHKYIGLYIETVMSYTQSRNIMVIEQTKLVNCYGHSLTKTLKPLLLKAYTNSLSTYAGQSTELGVYLSETPFEVCRNYDSATFFTLVKYSPIVIVADDMSVRLIDAPNKIVFNVHLGENVFRDATIDRICDIERQYQTTKIRSEIKKLLAEFEPQSEIKWYYFTSTLRKMVRRHCRRMIIGMLSKDIKGEKTETKSSNTNNSNTSFV
jgi:hypothetical protein